jgi:hypothetical protein
MLTPHGAAIARATEMASTLDQLVTEMRANGALKAFNQMFKVRRAAAAAEGRGFMSYGAASVRLRKMLAASLSSSGNARGAAAQFQFASIFERSKL